MGYTYKIGFSDPWVAISQIRRMMEKRYTTHFVVIFAVLVIVLAACRSNLQDQIIGQWRLGGENQETGLIFSFKEDDRVTIWFEDVPIKGIYSWLDEQTIQIAFADPERNAEIVGKVQIEGDQLTITNEQGDKDTLTRVE
jgi:hypothetical protein